jgi:hypothetical protein
MRAVDQLEVDHTYGELTILSKNGRDKRGNRVVQVRCSCGKEYEIHPHKIVNCGYKRCVKCAKKEGKARIHRCVSSYASKEKRAKNDEFVRQRLEEVKNAIYR